MRRFLLTVTLLLMTAAASADEPDVKITLTGAALTPAATSAAGGGLPNKSIVEVSGNFDYEIRCLQGATCDANGPTIMLASDKLTPDRTKVTVNNVPDVPRLTGSIDASKLNTEGTKFSIKNGENTLFELQLKKGEDKKDDEGEDETTPGDPCWTLTLEDIVGSPLPAGVHFLVSPGGSVQDRTTEPIDENDSVFVHVISSKEADLQHLEVTRTSATRTTGNLNILGGGIKITDLRRESAERSTTCYHRTYELGDFAPGEATVDLSMRDVTKRTSIGTMKFNVNKLYDGIISFGPVWSKVSDRKYALTPQGSDQIIVETETGNSDILYAAMYTYFWREKRDVEKPKPDARKRINPTLGFSLNDPADHALAGVSMDFGQVVITLGLHAARVTRLADDAGVQVGGKFTGTTIPTKKKWETGVFFSATIDARAARALFDAILPGSGSK